jgi:hypothetical protein
MCEFIFFVLLPILFTIIDYIILKNTCRLIYCNSKSELKSKIAKCGSDLSSIFSGDKPLAKMLTIKVWFLILYMIIMFIPILNIATSLVLTISLMVTITDDYSSYYLICENSKILKFLTSSVKL